MKKTENEIVEVLMENNESLSMEDIQSETTSPLNQAVVEKDIAGNSEEPKGWNVWKPKGKTETTEDTPNSKEEETMDSTSFTTETIPPQMEMPPTPDAPEQEIGENSNDEQSSDKDAEEEFELPTATAKQAADTILGMTNNVISVGGGFFVKMKKHKDFYDYQEVVDLIDEQNQKNVDRLKLDKDDKALLKPLLVTILKKKVKNLTPEQQLAGALLTIGMKKVQTVMEVRSENNILFDRILDVVQKEKKEEQDPLDSEVGQQNVAFSASSTQYTEGDEDPFDSEDVEHSYDQSLDAMEELNILETADDEPLNQ